MCNPTATTATAALKKEDPALSKTAPSPEDDPRPLVSDLLEKHKKTIATVKEAIQEDPLYDANRYDDIWILRFVLSHKKAKPAIEAALKTIQYRHEHKVNELGDVRHRIYNHQLSPDDNVDAFDVHKVYCGYGQEGKYGVMHTLPDPDRGMVTYIHPGHFDLGKIAKEMTAEELAEVYLVADESIFQIMDEVTRRTGKLTKLLRVMDMEDLSLLGCDRNYVKMDGAAAKANEDFYPQLLGTILIVNAPSWLYTTWKMLSAFFPKRMVEKLDFANPQKNKKDLKRFTKYISKENLAERYGGESPVWPPAYGGERFAKAKC